MKKIQLKHLAGVIADLCLLPPKIIPLEFRKAVVKRVVENRGEIGAAPGGIRALGLSIELTTVPKLQVRLLRELGRILDSETESLHTVRRLTGILPAIALEPIGRRLNEVLTKSMPTVPPPFRRRGAQFFFDSGMIDGPYEAFWESLAHHDRACAHAFASQVPMPLAFPNGAEEEQHGYNDMESGSGKEEADNTTRISENNINMEDNNLQDEWALAVIPHNTELSPEEGASLLLRVLGGRNKDSSKRGDFRSSSKRPSALWQASPESYRRLMVDIPARGLTAMAFQCTRDLAGLRPNGLSSPQSGERTKSAPSRTAGRKLGLSPVRPRHGHNDRERAREYVLALTETIACKTKDFREKTACATIWSLGRLVEENLLCLDDEKLESALTGLTHQLCTTKNLRNLEPVDVLRLSEGLCTLHVLLPYDVRPNLAHFIAWMLRSTMKTCPKPLLQKLMSIGERLDLPPHTLHRVFALRILRLGLPPQEANEMASPLIPHLPKVLQKRFSVPLLKE